MMQDAGCSCACPRYKMILMDRSRKLARDNDTHQSQRPVPFKLTIAGCVTTIQLAVEDMKKSLILVIRDGGLAPRVAWRNHPSISFIFFLLQYVCVCECVLFCLFPGRVFQTSDRQRKTRNSSRPFSSSRRIVSNARSRRSWNSCSACQANSAREAPTEGQTITIGRATTTR